LLNTVSWKYTNEGKISGLLGIMNYGGANFLGVIANHINVGKLNKANVNKISQIKIYPFNVSAYSKLGLERFI